MDNMKICIVGLGLIGGSLAKALRLKTRFPYIIGVDSNAEYINQAIKDGVLDEGSGDLLAAVQDADILFICTPLSKVTETIGKISPMLKPGAIVTDVGSTKQDISDVIQGSMPPHSIYIGGHPMAGSEKSGYLHSSPTLFENAYYILTAPSDVVTREINILQNMIRQIGGIPVLLTPKQHDHLTGIISHLPHIVASALVQLVYKYQGEEGYIRHLAAGGFRDITRIASSNPAMWRDVCLSNRHELMDLVKVFQCILSSVASSLENQDQDQLLEFFHTSKAFRDTLPDMKASLIPSYYDIYLDVEDKPGTIGEVATILGVKGINIKNIGIINSREEEPGALRISFSDKASQTLSSSILHKKGYKVYMKS